MRFGFVRNKVYTPGQETSNHTKTDSERKYQNDTIILLSQKLCITRHSHYFSISCTNGFMITLFPVVTALWDLYNHCISWNNDSNYESARHVIYSD